MDNTSDIKSDSMKLILTSSSLRSITIFLYNTHLKPGVNLSKESR